MIRGNVRFSVFTLVAALLISLCLTESPQVSMFNQAKVVSALPFAGMEYTNGTIIPENSPLLIWYDWVDVSGTQVINYAIYTTPDYNYPVPMANLLGQHFRLEDGTQVFIASALSGLEVYRDLNADGIPQADFASVNNELLYFMYTNMSDGYSMTSVQKTTEDSRTHYRWSFTYENAHGYLQNATARIGVVAALVFSHLTLSYDFSLNGNVSNLKTSFDIGKVTNLNILDSSQFSLDGLSLALLYATATYTSKPFSTYVDGEQYNSATEEAPTTEAEIAQINVNQTKAYEFIFGGNYTLNTGQTNQTQQAIIETYQAKAEAVAISGIPIPIRTDPVAGMSFFREQLNLAELFGGSWQDFNLNYEASSLNYRICFPVWNGMQIEHDPVYVAYLLSSNEETTPTSTPTTPTQFPTTTVMLVLIIAAVATLSIIVLAKTRKKPEKQNVPQNQ
jgi:hypothetical protein